MGKWLELPIGIYLLIVNLTAFAMYGIDKVKAQTHSWRISEKMLLGIAVIGGSLGALAGMKKFHHKTRKPVFKYGIPVIFAVQIIVVTFLEK